METMLKTDVVVIGAGPTGLALACQLVRYGLDVVVLDQKEGVTPYSKALGVHARTLEIYEQIGLAQKAIAQGNIAGKVRLLTGGQVRGELDLSNIGEGLSPYPYMLVLEQNKNERLLYDHLQAQGQHVLWQTELESFTQHDAGVTARVKTGDAHRTIEAKYLVGCDGPGSLVRHTLGLEFQGSTFERMFYVADAQIDWHLSHDALHLCLSHDSFLLFFPMKGENRYRIVGVFPEDFAKDEGEVLYEEIEARIKAESQLALDIHDVGWFSTYKVHTRHAARFSAGRCFLAGDAAHIHSPAGAQGMNTGIQDGYNLAWKLALVIQGRAAVKLLETYNEERLENAKHLLQTTDRLFQLGAGSEWLLTFLRTNVLPHVANSILHLEAVRNFIFPLISQIGITYRHSSLSAHAGDEEFNIKAGDRMPYFVVNGQSIYDRLRQPRFHSLIFSNAPGDFQPLKTQLETEYAAQLDCHIVSLNRQISDIFGTSGDFQVLLRPDNHIAFLSTEISSQRLAAYCNEWAAHV